MHWHKPPPNYSYSDSSQVSEVVHHSPSAVVPCLICSFLKKEGQYYSSYRLALSYCLNADRISMINHRLATSLYTLAPLTGPAIGPIAGAWIAARTSWRWVRLPPLDTLFHESLIRVISSGLLCRRNSRRCRPNSRLRTFFLPLPLPIYPQTLTSPVFACVYRYSSAKHTPRKSSPTKPSACAKKRATQTCARHSSAPTGRS